MRDGDDIMNLLWEQALQAEVAYRTETLLDAARRPTTLRRWGVLAAVQSRGRRPAGRTARSSARSVRTAAAAERSPRRVAHPAGALPTCP